MLPTLVIRSVTWLVCALVGFVYAAAGTISHSFRSAGLPVGLVIAMVGVAGMFIAVRILLQDRWAALAAALGAMASTLMLSGEGPGGSVLVTQSILGVVWTLWVPLVAAVVVAWPDQALRASAPGTAR